MNFNISGGLSQFVADVTRVNRLKVLAVSQASTEQNALKDARTWTVSGTETPAAANDYFVFIRNDSARRNIVVSRVAVDGGTADNIEVQAVTVGTLAGGTDATPVNRTVGSTKLPASSTVQTGADITGLTSAGTFERLVVAAGGKDEVDLTKRPVVLRQNQAVALLAVTGTAALNFEVDIWEDLTDPVVVD